MLLEMQTFIFFKFESVMPLFDYINPVNSPEEKEKELVQMMPKALAERDHIVTWSKPKSKPKGISLSEYKSLPETLKVREGSRLYLKE